MTNSQRLAIVRDRLRAWLAEHINENTSDSGVSALNHQIKAESFLIRDGFFCGRRFELADHRAVWFLEEDELKIFARDGGLLVTLSTQDLNEESAEPEASSADLDSITPSRTDSTESDSQTLGFPATLAMPSAQSNDGTSEPSAAAGPDAADEPSAANESSVHEDSLPQRRAA